MSESGNSSATVQKPVTADVLKWRNVFPGDERQISVLRRWLIALLPECPARDDVITVGVELATNAVKFSGSGRDGWFAVEITCYGHVVRVAVADGGGPTGPHMIDDPAGDHGRGLVMVRALSTRTGVCGDHRGRLVWAEVAWTGDGAVAVRPSPDAYETAIHHDEAALARRFAGVAIWFGRCTLQWWALLGPAWGDRLLTAPSARELGELLDRTLLLFGRLWQVAPDDARAARAAEAVRVAVAPVPPRSHQGRARVQRLGTQPC